MHLNWSKEARIIQVRALNHGLKYRSIPIFMPDPDMTWYWPRQY